MTQEALAAVVAVLSEEYRVVFSGDRVRLWGEVLAPYEDEDVLAAVRRLLGERPFEPRVADIVHLAAEVRRARMALVETQDRLHSLPEPTSPAVAQRWLAEIHASIAARAAERAEEGRSR